MARGEATNDLRDEISQYICYSVTATNGLKLGVVAGPSGTNTVDDEVWLFFSLEREGILPVYVPRDEYLVRIELFDSHNLPLPKTTAGRSYQLAPRLKWDKSRVRLHQRSPQLWPVWKGRSVAHSAEGQSPFYREWTEFLKFPPPSQLFRIEKVGAYRLVMEFQVFVKKGVEKPVVRFPPLEIPVVRSDSGPPPAAGRGPGWDGAFTNHDGLVFGIAVPTHVAAGERIRVSLMVSNALGVARNVPWERGDPCRAGIGEILILEEGTGRRVGCQVPDTERDSIVSAGLGTLKPRESAQYAIDLVKGYGLTNSGRYLLQGVGQFRLLSRPDQYFTLTTPPVRLLITNSSCSRSR